MLVAMDLSSVGRCSAMAVIPVLSLAGSSVAFLPTAYLSTHTGGFGQVHRSDMSRDMRGSLAHWKRLGLRFNAVYIGYAADHSQLLMLEDALPDLMAEGAALYVDPVMGDQGRRYSYCGEELISAFRRLCARADAIFPNRTEAALLLGLPLKEGEEPEPPAPARLLSLGARQVVLTGALDGRGGIGVQAASRDGRQFETYRRRYPGAYPGTGDLLASCVIAGLTAGMALETACETACDFLDLSLKYTQAYDAPPRFGLAFERALPFLSRAFTKGLPGDDLI